jgi:uncharacterized damage-inducible protein DinB
MPTTTQIHTALIQEVEHRLFDESLPRILECLEKLTDEQIWWRPNESSNSIGNLVLHLCGNVRQWIGTGLGHHPDNRKRQTEFDERRVIERDVLVSELVATMTMAKSVISNFPETELLTSRPVQTFNETGMSILIHVTEHFSYHTGQIAYITKWLSGKSLSFYEGVVLE